MGRTAGEQVKGLFYGAPSHDVPALIAFLTILITTVNFVVSVEVNFYPKYRNYYSLFNDGGTIKGYYAGRYRNAGCTEQRIEIYRFEAVTDYCAGRFQWVRVF